MLLGLLADIHEEVELLDACIDRLNERGVERFVILGDIFEVGPRLVETVCRLQVLPSVGVWGNHDFGLCREVSDYARQLFPPMVFDYFGTLLPRVEIEGCLFQHIEPHLDATSLEDLWSYGGEGRLSTDCGLRTVPHRRVFMGHLHRWEARTTSGQLDWNGTAPLTLPEEQTLLVIPRRPAGLLCDLRHRESGTDTLSGSVTPGSHVSRLAHCQMYRINQTRRRQCRQRQASSAERRVHRAVLS